MEIVLLCATARGHMFLQKLRELSPDSRLTVFSFREESWEPPFLDEIRELAQRHDCRFFEARQVGSERWNQFWETTNVDLMFVVSWRYMIPAVIYRRPRLGTFVFHDSLLPQYRGFSPTVWAMINGERETGVTLFEVAEEVDAGDIVDQQSILIGPDDTVALLMQRVTASYLDLLERNWKSLSEGNAPRRRQDHSRATYTCKRLPEDNRIDWTASSETIYNLIRAVGRPYTGAYTYLMGRKLIVWSAERATDSRRYAGRIPGRVAEVRPGVGSLVLTGDGALLLKQVQTESGETVSAAEVLNSLNQTLRAGSEPD